MRRLLVFTALVFALDAHAQARFVPLGFLPGATYSYANGVSSDSSTVVGSSYGDSIDQAFRWTQEGGIHGLGAELVLALAPLAWLRARTSGCRN